MNGLFLNYLKKWLFRHLSFNKNLEKGNKLQSKSFAPPMQSIDINWPIFKGHAIVSIGRQKTNLQKNAFYVTCNKHVMKDSRMSRKILLIDIKH